MSRARHAVDPGARRYARALFLAALERGQLEAVAADVAALGEAFADPAAAAWLADPRVEERAKGAALGRIGERSHLLLRGLFEVLARRRRHAVLAGLPLAFRDVLDAHQGLLRGVIESARALGDDDRARLEAAFAARTGQSVVLEARVDPTLLGGARVTLAGRRYDGSARGRLERLRARLAETELAPAGGAR